jgi:hypothetical protein
MTYLITILNLYHLRRITGGYRPRDEKYIREVAADEHVRTALPAYWAYDSFARLRINDQC